MIFQDNYVRVFLIFTISKDSSIVIKKNLNYIAKLETMVHDGIIKDTYLETADNTLKELL